ncbi:hypothetical protein Tco_1251292 [Tanacetum coccineum]
MSLWNRLLDFIANHNGQYVIFGEFNDVQDESERYVMDSSPDFKVIALPRGWSDHTPLLLLYENDEYGRLNAIDGKIDSGIALEEEKHDRLNLIKECDDIQKLKEMDTT